MPGHDQHRRLAEAVATVVALAAGVGVWLLLGRPYLAVTAGSLGFVAVTVGSQLPDIDAPTSVPRRRLTRLLQVGLVLGIVGGAVAHASHVQRAAHAVARTVRGALPPAVIAVAGVVAACLAGLATVPRLLQWLLPRHRGPLHRLWFWAVLIGASLAAAYALYGDAFAARPVRITVLVAAGTGGLLVGVGVHVAADRLLG